MLSHFESRASRDINLLHFYKNMFKIERYLNSTKELNVDSDINLCRVFPKISIPQDLKYRSFQPNQIGRSIKYIAKKNDFSDWDVNAILKAKTTHANPKYFFEERMLDKYFNDGEESMESRFSKGIEQS